MSAEMKASLDKEQLNLAKETFSDKLNDLLDFASTQKIPCEFVYSFLMMHAEDQLDFMRKWYCVDPKKKDGSHEH